MSTIKKVIEMLNKCTSFDDVYCVKTTVSLWKMPETERASLEKLFISEAISFLNDEDAAEFLADQASC